jgi:hypothetical protein
MQVFVEFARSDVSEDQILPVLRELLPVLMNILLSQAVSQRSLELSLVPDATSLLQNSPTTRAQAVKVFSQCVENLYMVKDQHPQATKEAVSSILPSWVTTFHHLLLDDPRSFTLQSGKWELWAIRLEIYRVCKFIDFISMSQLHSP